MTGCSFGLATVQTTLLRPSVPVPRELMRQDCHKSHMASRRIQPHAFSGPSSPRFLLSRAYLAQSGSMRLARNVPRHCGHSMLARTRAYIATAPDIAAYAMPIRRPRRPTLTPRQSRTRWTVLPATNISIAMANSTFHLIMIRVAATLQTDLFVELHLYFFHVHAPSSRTVKHRVSYLFLTAISSLNLLCASSTVLPSSIEVAKAIRSLSLGPNEN